jgi:GMP synthase PP-ATPase subunit
VDQLREKILGMDGVSGLLLDVTSKPPGTIEWE